MKPIFFSSIPREKSRREVSSIPIKKSPWNLKKSLLKCCEETVLANKMVFGMSFNAAKVLFVDLRPGWPGYLISRGGRVRAY